MKGKLALVTFLATAVTIGGVYATWSFAEGNTTSATTTVNVAMTGLGSTSEKGTLIVTVMNEGGFTLAVDDANGDHSPEIKKEGKVTITFTPSQYATQEVKTNGIDISCWITYAPYENGPATLETWQYGDAQIFNISQTESKPFHLAASAATKANGVFTWTVSGANVGIDLTDAFKALKIDTLVKYNALNTILAKGHFVFTVSECKTDHTASN
jgi:hypothetical protein